MAQRFFNPNPQFFDDNGVILNGGKLYFYEAGTSTPLDTYSDESLTTANDNPVILDSAGRVGDIFLKNQKYKYILKDSSNATIRTVDPYSNQDKSGTQTQYIPAQALTPTISNGCGSISYLETTAGNPDIIYLPFDSSSDEHAQFSVTMPNSWDLGTVTATFHWTAASGSGGVAWGLQGVAVSDDDTIDVGQGTGVVVTDTFITAEDMHITSESSAITIGGSPAQGDHVFFMVYRDVSDAADTLAVDAYLIGVTLRYTTDAGNDD